MNPKFNLVLTSSGFINRAKRSAEIDALFALIANEKKVLLLTNATRKGNNTDSVEAVRTNFISVGARVVDLLEIDKNNANSIFDYQILYCLGGDLQAVLEDFWKANFKNRLVQFLEKGIYIGESAGSIVLADDTKWCFDIKRGTKAKYDVPLASYEGMGVTKRYVYPHYNAATDETRAKILKYTTDNLIEIVCLNDGEYILENKD